MDAEGVVQISGALRRAGIDLQIAACITRALQQRRNGYERWALR